MQSSTFPASLRRTSRPASRPTPADALPTMTPDIPTTEKDDNGSWLLRCPRCRAELALATVRCRCNYEPQAGTAEFKRFYLHDDPTNVLTTRAYRLYAKLYAPIALLSYWFVWRGNLSRHIAFFRECLGYSKDVVDLATGDGSLSKTALFAWGKVNARSVLALDISYDMLRKARRRFRRKPVAIVAGDVLDLPFSEASVGVMTCFGGMNSFPSCGAALQEMARVLKPGGILRGSLLLFPTTPWRQKLVRRWIAQGYQTAELSLSSWQDVVAASGLQVYIQERHGDVLLFELRKA